jgi:hypothetical protein
MYVQAHVMSELAQATLKVSSQGPVSIFLIRALTQLWCKANWLRNSRGEQTSAKQFEAGATIHLPLKRFQPVDVAFHRTIAE